MRTLCKCRIIYFNKCSIFTHCSNICLGPQSVFLYGLSHTVHSHLIRQYFFCQFPEPTTVLLNWLLWLWLVNTAVSHFKRLHNILYLQDKFKSSQKAIKSRTVPVTTHSESLDPCLSLACTHIATSRPGPTFPLALCNCKVLFHYLEVQCATCSKTWLDYQCVRTENWTGKTPKPYAVFFLYRIYV